jgi:hypothetical protein
MLEESNKEVSRFMIGELGDIRIRISGTNDESVLITCCPKQILGPPLKGQKIKGFGTRYLCSLSSKNLSGSNSRANGKHLVLDSYFQKKNIKSIRTVRSPQISSALHIHDAIYTTFRETQS